MILWILHEYIKMHKKRTIIALISVMALIFYYLEILIFVGLKNKKKWRKLDR